MPRKSPVRSQQSRPSLFRPRGLRLEWLEDRTVPTTLTLALADPTRVEGQETTATIARTGDLSQALTVKLDSSDPSEVTLPATVVIPAGEASANFVVGAVDDTDGDGLQSVNLLAWVEGAGGTAYATLRVLDNDSPPSVLPNSYDAGEDETLNVSGFGVLNNDFSPNGELTATVVSGPAHGTLTLNPGGSFSYTPAPNYNGPDTFTYRATDEAGLSGEATVSLTVWGMDDHIQFAAPGPQTTAEEAPLTFSAANGNAITVTDIESPRVLVALLVNGGILTLPGTAGLEFPYPESVNNSPHITFHADDPAEANAALEGLVFTPDANYNGTASLSILVRDLTSQSFPIEEYAVVPIAVTPVNDAPVAATNSYEVNEDRVLTVTGSGVLGNDTDPDGDALSAVLVSGPAHGTLALNADGSFTYTPNPNFAGQDSFTYRATDAGGLGGAATVSLTVWGVNDQIAVTVPGAQAVAEDESLTFSAANGNAITIIDPESPRVLINMSAFGTLSLTTTDGLEFPYPEAAGNNSSWIIFYADSPAVANAALDGLVFTPFPDSTDVVTLIMSVRDETTTPTPPEAWGEFLINITPVNDAAVAVADGPYTVEAGELLTVNNGSGWPGLGVLDNDQDADWDMLSAVLETGPAHGTLTLNANGSFTYTADPAYSGTDTFTYRASDGQLTSGPVTVTINVTPRNQPPTSAFDRYWVNEDTTLVVGWAFGVLYNDTDPEGQPETAELVSGPSHGTLALNANGGFTYTPTANYNGTDVFWYRPFDGVRYGEPTYAELIVNPVNDAAVASPDSYAVNEDAALNVAAAGVLGNDTDVEGDALSAVVVSGPSHGTLTFNADGSFTYTPAPNYTGPDSFTYRSADPSGAGSVATVSLTVNPVNDPPVALDDTYTATEEVPLSVTVAGTTSLHMTSDTGDYIGQGQSYSFSPATGTFTVSRNYDNGVTIHYSSGSQYFHFDFAAPDEGLLLPGLYSGAMDFPFQDPGRPGMYISSNGRAPSNITGWFRVNEVAYGPTGEVLVFNVTFEQHNNGGTPALRGTLRYNAGATAAGGVLLNDSDLEGNRLTASLVDGPANGQVFLNPNGTFMYLPNPNFAGVDTFRYKVSDGTSESNVATVTIDVAGVNDAPVNVVPPAQTLVEDTTLTFSTANGNAIRLTDADAGDSVIELRLSVNGFLTFPTTAGLTFVSGSNGGNLITVQGTLADLNAALDGLVFRPGSNFTGNYTLQVRTSDLGNSGSGGVRTDTDNITLSITPVNDAPQNVVPLAPPVTAEDTAITFNPWVWVADPDQTTGAANAPVRVTVEFAAGTGTLAVTPSSGVTITGNATTRVDLVGTITNVNTVLRTLRFTPAADANNLTAPVQIRVTTDDQANGGPGALTDTDTFSVSVTPVNDLPQLTLSTTQVSVPMNGGAHSVAGFATGAVGPATATDELATQTLSYGSEVTATTGSLAFAAAPTVAANGTLTFTPAAGTWGTATVRVWSSDGVGVSSDRTFTISVTNTAPTTAGLPPVSVAEDAAPTSVTLTDSFADVEDGSGGLTYAVVGNTNPGLFTSATVSGGVLTLAYAPNAYGSATLTVRATDSGGLSVDKPLSVTVSPVNDAPTSTGLPPVVVAEDTAATNVALTNYFSDLEDSSSGLVYAVVGNTNPGLFAATSVSNGVLTLSFAPNANGSATLTVRATDSGGLSVERPLAVTVNAVNDAPTFVIGSNVTVASGAGAQTRPGWASSISRGPADESGQALTFAVWADNPLLFAVQPSVNPATGTLTFTPAVGASGATTVTVVLQDDGGTANGGANASAPATFTITLAPPAGQPGVQVIGTELVITGAGGNDSVTISTISGGNGSNGAKVTGTVNGQSVNKTFRQTLTRIRINTAGGNDSVTVADGIALPTVIDAGAGDDYVKGGGGADLVFGGDGVDTINGAAGDDNVHAGAGNDSVTGGLGRDLLLGGDGDDTIQGGDGNDFLIGGLGADQLYGQNGFDILVGGSVVARTPASDSLRQILTDWDPALPGIYANLRTRLVVTDDPVSVDRLQGDAGTDWFLSWDALDVLDLASGEQRN